MMTVSISYVNMYSVTNDFKDDIFIVIFWFWYLLINYNVEVWSTTLKPPE